MSTTSNIPATLPNWMKDWPEETPVDDWAEAQEHTCIQLATTGVPESEYAKVTVAGRKFVYAKWLDAIIDFDDTRIWVRETSNPGTIITSAMIDSGSISHVRRAVAELTTKADKAKAYNAEQRRLAALPKYITGMLDNYIVFGDWLNKHAADGYTLVEFNADADDYIHAVMVREA